MKVLITEIHSSDVWAPEFETLKDKPLIVDDMFSNTTVPGYSMCRGHFEIQTGIDAIDHVEFTGEEHPEYADFADGAVMFSAIKYKIVG